MNGRFFGIASLALCLTLGASSFHPATADDKDANSLIDLLELELQGIPPAFSLVALEKDLNRVAQSMYLAKAAVVRKAADLVSAIPAPKSDNVGGESSEALLRLFVMNAIQPVIEDAHTIYFDGTIIPKFRQGLARHNQHFGKQSLDDFGDLGETRVLALRLFQAGLEASAEFVGEGEDRQALVDMRAALGTAFASDFSDDDVAAAISCLRSHETMLYRLVDGGRTHGIGMMLTALEEFLKAR